MSVALHGRIAGALLTLLAATVSPHAQDNFPSRPISVVTPYGPGTVADVFGRIVAQNMATQWNGASIVFESRSGANGSIAAEEVARSAPQGEFAAIIKCDVALWGRIVREAGIAAD